MHAVRLPTLNFRAIYNVNGVTSVIYHNRTKVTSRQYCLRAVGQLLPTMCMVEVGSGDAPFML